SLEDQINRLIQPVSPEMLAREKELLELTKNKKTLKERIIACDLNSESRATIYEWYLRWEQMPCTDQEKGKLKERIEYALSIPQIIKPIFQAGFSSFKV